MKLATPEQKSSAEPMVRDPGEDILADGRPSAPEIGSSGRVKPKGGRQLQNLAMWSRQLYVLVHTGTALVPALTAVERQVAAGPWREVLEDIRHQLDEGVAFADAVAKHPAYFSPVARSLIAAGESSGQLDTMLDRIARLTRQQLRVRRSLIGSMVYPVLLITVSIVVVIAMIGFVLPRFAELFDTMDAALPPTTQVLMVLSEIGRAHWLPIIIAIIVAVVGAKMLLDTNGGRRALHCWLVRAPQIGRIIRSFETAKIARLLGVLIESKVDLLDAIRLTQSSAGNIRYEQLMHDAEEAVTRGESISGVFARSPLIRPSVAEALRHGEHSGQMGSIMVEMADFIDEENETIIRTLSSIIEPVILIVLGAVVAFIAMSMFLPLFDLTAMAQGG